MKLGFISSGALHLLVVLIVWLGLPHIKRDPPKLDELIFVKLADVAKVTNLPPDMDTQPKKKSKTKSPNTKQSEESDRLKQATIPIYRLGIFFIVIGGIAYLVKKTIYSHIIIML